MANDGLTMDTTTSDAPAKPKRERKTKTAKPAKGKAKKVAAKAKSGESKSVIDQSKYDYVVTDVKTASGRKSVDTGDNIAKAMRGLDAKGALAALRANDLKPNPAWAEKGLNPGMIRMNVGNMLRRVVRQGGKVKIGDKTVASLGK